MNCRYVQSRLSAYLDMELSGVEQQQIRSHLEQCIECSCELESLRRTKQILRQMPVVVPPSGPERVLLQVRQSTPAPRRSVVFNWRATRWWQYAGGFALAAAFMLWSQSKEPTQDTDASSTANFTAVSSPIFTYPLSLDPVSAHRFSPLFQFRRSSNPIAEPVLMPTVSYSSHDPLLGYQPVSSWNDVPVAPRMVETRR
ncbi:MAG: anti-sigma factor family protein [Fimbriimonadales bacterium]